MRDANFYKSLMVSLEVHFRNKSGEINPDYNYIDKILDNYNTARQMYLEMNNYKVKTV